MKFFIREVISIVLLLVLLHPVAAAGDPPEVIWIIDGQVSDELPEGNLNTLVPSDSAGYIDRASFEIKSRFSREGYFSAEVDSLVKTKSDNPGEALLYISRGDRYRVGTIRQNLISYENAPEPDLPFSVEGNLYANELLEEYFSALITYYEERGYPLAQVSIEEFAPNPETHEVELTIEIRPGEQIYTDGLSFNGLDRLEASWLQQVINVPDSTLITPELMSRSRRSLEQTELFDFVSEPEIHVREETSQLHFTVEELPATSFDILVGYVPDRGTPDASGNTVIGQADLEVRNILRQGSSLEMIFERMEPLVTRLDLGYRQEWVLGMPISAGGNFDFLQQDTTYQVRNLRLRAGYHLSSTTSIEATARRQNTSANTNPDLPIRALDGSSTFFGAGFRFRSTDDRYSPTTGMELYLHAETGFRNFSDPRADQFTLNENQRQQRIELRLQPYFSPAARHVITPRLNAFYLDGEDLTESDMKRFGGARSLRGFREEQFLVSRVVWADAEYRYLLAPRSYGFLFGATGHYSRDPYITESSLEETEGTGVDWLFSYGLGFSYETPVGFVRFSYAIAGETSPAEGLVHFGVSSRF